MFDKDFYPTPAHVIDMMQIDCFDKVVLEPSAGSGNIIDWLHDNAAKKILSYERNEDLALIAKQKSNFLGYDFLKAEKSDLSHIDLIVANPPFSTFKMHFEKMWDIAPEGCEIISLCNYDSVKNMRYTRTNNIIKTHGTFENLGDVFSNAERNTNIDIGLIKVFKPITSEKFNWEDYFFMDEEVQENNSEGLMPYNQIRAYVNRYIRLQKAFTNAVKEVEHMNSIYNNVISSDNLSRKKFNIDIGSDGSTLSLVDFSKSIQKESWYSIFRELNIEKYVTSKVSEDINNFVESHYNIPFTMKNIYKMLDVIFGTRVQNFKRGLEEVVDNFTRHTHKNRYNVEGWKTNEGHLLNKKFIIENYTEIGWSGYMSNKRMYGHNNRTRLEDLQKILCHLTATDFDRIDRVETVFEKTEKMEFGTWYQSHFFDFKGFKKGTLHLKFKDEKVWEILNKKYAEIKGLVLPE